MKYCHKDSPSSSAKITVVSSSGFFCVTFTKADEEHALSSLFSVALDSSSKAETTATFGFVEVLKNFSEIYYTSIQGSKMNNFKNSPITNMKCLLILSGKKTFSNISWLATPIQEKLPKKIWNLQWNYKD